MSTTIPKAENLVAFLDDGLWTVEDRTSRRWWTATGDDENALITSDGGRIVLAATATGKKVRAAVAEAKSR